MVEFIISVANNVPEGEYSISILGYNGQQVVSKELIIKVINPLIFLPLLIR